MRYPRCNTELLDANETIGFCPKCRVLQTHTHLVTNGSPNSSVRKGSDNGSVKFSRDTESMSCGCLVGVAVLIIGLLILALMYGKLMSTSLYPV